MEAPCLNKGQRTEWCIHLLPPPAFSFFSSLVSSQLFCLPPALPFGGKGDEIQAVSSWVRKGVVTVDRNDTFASLTVLLIRLSTSPRLQVGNQRWGGCPEIGLQLLSLLAVSNLPPLHFQSHGYPAGVIALEEYRPILGLHDQVW